MFFFAGLMGLTVYAMQDFPTGTTPLNMSLKAFHLIFVTLLTALSFGCAAWAFSRRRHTATAFGLAGSRRRHPGHHLRNLFFEEIEKHQLPMKSFRKL